MRVIEISPTIQEFDGWRYYLSGRYFRRNGALLHRVVWAHHHGPIPPKHHVHHKTGDRSRNQVEDLELMRAGEHLSLHMKVPGRAEISRRSLPKARAAAAEWHASPEGREWHRAQHAKHVAPLFKKKVDKVCQRQGCGKAYQTAAITAVNSVYCSNSCKTAARRASGVDDIVRKCAACGGDFSVNKYSPVRTCSTPCRTVIWREARYQCMAAAPSTVSTRAVSV
jgi:hypothetical protein